MNIKKTARKVLLASSLLLGTGAAMADGNSTKEIDFQEVIQTSEGFDVLKGNLENSEYSTTDLESLIIANEENGSSDIFEVIANLAHGSKDIDVSNSIFKYGYELSPDALNQVFDKFYVSSDAIHHLLNSGDHDIFNAVLNNGNVQPVDISELLYNHARDLADYTLTNALNNFDYSEGAINRIAGDAKESGNNYLHGIITGTRAEGMLSQENRKFDDDLGSNFIVTPSADDKMLAATKKPSSKKIV